MLEITERDECMYILKSEKSFDAAHFLAGYQGKCKNIHGHRWRILAEIQAETLQENGSFRAMVTDFGDIKKDLGEIADRYDHSLIVEEGSLKPATVAALQDEDFRMVVIPFRPTAENFAKSIYMELKEKGYRVRSVEVYETPANSATYCE